MQDRFAWCPSKGEDLSKDLPPTIGVVKCQGNSPPHVGQRVPSSEAFRSNKGKKRKKRKKEKKRKHCIGQIKVVCHTHLENACQVTVFQDIKIAYQNLHKYFCVGSSSVHLLWCHWDQPLPLNFVIFITEIMLIKFNEGWVWKPYCQTKGTLKKKRNQT